MPRESAQPHARQFAARLLALLTAGGTPRRGLGKMLSDRYGVSVVTANAWLNGDHLPAIPQVKRLAKDYKTDFDTLYFGKPSGVRETARPYDASWPFEFDRMRLLALTEKQRNQIEGVMMGLLVEFERANRTANIAETKEPRGALQRR